MADLNIKNGFWYGAGSKFKWSHEHHIHGVGIAEKFFKGNKEVISVSVGGAEYTCDLQNALRFIKKYGSIETRGGIRIGVISRDLLVPVIKDDSVNKKLF